MLMRYHWGLAPGHVYTHTSNTTAPAATMQAPNSVAPSTYNNLDTSTSTAPMAAGTSSSTNEFSTLYHLELEMDEDGDYPEFGFENRQDDLIGEDEFDKEGYDDDDEGEEGGDEFMGMD
jgi:hypothetical protein